MSTAPLSVTYEGSEGRFTVMHLDDCTTTKLLSNWFRMRFKQGQQLVKVQASTQARIDAVWTLWVATTLTV